MNKATGELAVYAATAGTASLLTVKGVLNGSTYVRLRDAIIKAALDEPRAVLVDINALDVTASSALSVFTSARWHVQTWPDVVIMLVCADAARRSTIADSAVTRYVPVHATVEAALSVLPEGRRLRGRARAELPASLASLRRAREFVAEWLADWSQAEFIPVATVIVNVFVENVLQHTASAPVLVLEADRFGGNHLGARRQLQRRRLAAKTRTGAASGCPVWLSSRRPAGHGAAHRHRTGRRSGRSSARKTGLRVTLRCATRSANGTKWTGRRTNPSRLY